MQHPIKMTFAGMGIFLLVAQSAFAMDGVETLIKALPKAFDSLAGRVVLTETLAEIEDEQRQEARAEALKVLQVQRA